METTLSRFGDQERSRRLTFLAPEGHEPSRVEVDLVEVAFREECETYPETVKLVGIYTKQGRLALDVFASGSEAALHAQVKRWGKMMYPTRTELPVGHEWTIDSPENVRAGMIE